MIFRTQPLDPKIGTHAQATDARHADGEFPRGGVRLGHHGRLQSGEDDHSGGAPLALLGVDFRAHRQAVVSHGEALGVGHVEWPLQVCERSLGELAGHVQAVAGEDEQLVAVCG